MIKATKLIQTIGDTVVLRDIDVHINPNIMTSILGPNGAGKTSLLKCLSGTHRNYSGEVHFKDRPIQDFALLELAKQRAVVMQSSQLSFPFTTMEIVMMGRNPYLGENPASYDIDIAEAALHDVDAYAFKDRIFTTLSGGEQQRVQLARALAQIWEQEHSVLFLDEPTSALDLKHQHHILALCQQLTETRSLTVITILHDLNLAMHYCDESILMKDAEIHHAGKSNDILTKESIETIYEIPGNIVERFHIACA